VCQPERLKALDEQTALIESELNVKKLKLESDRSRFFRRALKADWRAAGAHLRREVGRFRQIFESLSEEARAEIVAHLQDDGQVHVPGFEQPVPASLFRIEQESDPRFGVAEEGDLLVALDLELTPELKREGLVRDLVRNLQVMRKDAGLSVSQRIELGLHTESNVLQEAICEYRDYIQDELLATRLEEGILEPANARQEIVIEGETVLATMRW
jgi:isoleucyl-tRNA synthetase